MKIADPRLAPSAEYALINIYRPSSLGFAVKCGLWDGESLVGVSTSKTVVQYLAKPGDHFIMARSESWYLLKARLEAEINATMNPEDGA